MGQPHRFAGWGSVAHDIFISHSSKKRAWAEAVCSTLEANGIYIALGDRDAAFYWLDRSINDRSDEMILLKVDPAYAPLRSDARFAELRKRVGLPD